MAINGQVVTLWSTFDGGAVHADVVVGSSRIDVAGDGFLYSPAGPLLVEQIMSSVEPTG